jgi:hypothetical protein
LEQEYRAKQLQERMQEIDRRIRAHERPAPKPEFVYQARSPEQWDARALQSEPDEDKVFVYQARSPELWAERANQRTSRRWEMSHGHWRLTAEGRKQLAEKVEAMLDLARKYQYETDMEELARNADRSVSWVRKHLAKAGIKLPLRRQRQP